MANLQVNLRSNAIKRIMKDIKENIDHPVDGISICMPNEDDIFTLHGNIKIMNGIYKDIVLHVIIHLPNDYPHTGPAMNIAPGIDFGHKFHEHIFDDTHHGNSICNDLLTNFANFFQSNKKVASGWSPGYTLNTILMQMGLFFEDPDLPQKMVPLSEHIEKFKMDLQKFKCANCKHTTTTPYPPIVFQQKQEKSVPSNKNHEALLEKITCSVSKMNIVSDESLVLGCPLNVKLNRFGRIWAVPILETISYETYIGEIQKAGVSKLESYSDHYFTSALGQQYNFWIPYYLSKKHFERGFQTIINAISVIKHGTADGVSKFDFKPTDALDVLLSLCNKTVVNILDNKIHESKVAIEGYVHFLRLLMEFIDRYPTLQKKIDDTISLFKQSRVNRNKSSVPDIGEFIITLFLSKYKYEDIKHELLEEYFARQIFWLQKKTVNLMDTDKTRLLKNCFEASKISCQLLVFNLQMAKTFIFDGIKEKLDARYGFPPDNIVDSFQETIKNIKTNIVSYPQFIKYINFQDVIKSPDHMVEYIKQSKQLSKIQGYTK
jgi:ubiquitin-protein ligase